MAAVAHASNRISETLLFEERIRRRAYELKRGNESGSEQEDWFQAEQEILLAQDKQGEK